MKSVSLSLWLPVGRVNFYSVTADEWLMGIQDAKVITCSSNKLLDASYVPSLQTSVLRRLLEVLPKSFGYSPVGECELSSEGDERTRPMALTMKLVPEGDVVRMADGPQRRANIALAREGVLSVRLRADENGCYAFSAFLPADANDAGIVRVKRALLGHVSEVFGGDYSIDRIGGERLRRPDSGAAAVRQYNGLDDYSQDVLGPPRGALTFFQLNTIVEGLYNDMLFPAVFFEQHDYVERWLQRGDSAISALRTIGQIVEALTIDADAVDFAGQIVTLHHFLAATSRESVQRLSWSVASVLRGALDEMMGTLHRRSRLVQLDAGALERERTPVLAVGASEAQMRGFVMLVASKLPLIKSVHQLAAQAVDQFDAAARRSGGTEADDIAGVRMQLRQWKALLDDVSEDVYRLERTIEQAWMERTLYEQQQMRSGQETMAEIERSRQSRPVARGGNDAYTGMMLVLVAISLIFVIRTTNVQDLASPSLSDLAKSLWPIAVLSIVFLLVPVSLRVLRRRNQESQGVGDVCRYEFAFRLDEPIDPERFGRYLNLRRHRLRADGLRRLSIRNLGGRIERTSLENSLLEFHAVCTLQVSPTRFARFEIINEIAVQTVSNRIQHVLVQCRMFGESPRRLTPREILLLVRTILTHYAQEFVADRDIDTEGILLQLSPIYSTEPRMMAATGMP